MAPEGGRAPFCAVSFYLHVEPGSAEGITGDPVLRYIFP